MGTEPDLPNFVLHTGRGTLETSGDLHRVSESSCREAALGAGSIVVGMLPFDPDAEPLLWVPDGHRWIDESEPESESARPAERARADAEAGSTVPRPTRAIGVESPEYRAAVAHALERIHRGELEKVVLSRIVELRYDAEPLDLRRVFHELIRQHPQAYPFSVVEPGKDRRIMGASPELVVRVKDGRCWTHPLAGSAARRISAGPTEDAQAGEELLRSAKDRAEHAAVVDDVASRLGPLCEELTVPAAPSLLATPQLWHLGTSIEGRLIEGITALDVARAIHPTPAICGVPRQAAFEEIQAREPRPRAYFGGLVGWMDPDGNGEWVLNLRSARVERRRVLVRAGAGIVRGSTPEGEHRETAVKLSTFLAALGLTIEDLAECAG